MANWKLVLDALTGLLTANHTFYKPLTTTKQVFGTKDAARLNRLSGASNAVSKQ
jgi:hypothetical protein